MAIESRKVFIDTQSFVKMGLNFSHPALQAFLKLCKSNRLTHNTTTVVIREVESKIDDSIKEALKSLFKFRRKARLLEKINDDSIGVLFEEIDENNVRKKAIEVFREYLKESKSKVLTASGIDAEIILQQYFNKEPPFGDKKKKSEFPDAISIQSLLNEIGDSKAYVISEDQDFVKFCALNNNLINIESLEKFLDLYNEHESVITDLIKNHVATIDMHIKSTIEKQIEYLWAYNEAPWEDSNVDELKVTDVHDINPTVVFVDEKECLITFDVDVDIEYTVTGPDFNNGIYDKEDGRMYTFDTTTNVGSSTTTLTVEMEFSYDYKDGILKDIKELEVAVLGMDDGVAVYLDETPEEL